MRSNTYIVCGTYRSATSFITHCLENAGIYMGKDMLGKSSTNPEGHFENMDFLRLNEKILEKAGGSWCKPPSREAIKAVIPKFRVEIEELIANTRVPFWGWKDPRNCLTVEFILPYITGDKYLVCIFRNPTKVIHSLTTKYRVDNEKMTEEMATNITTTYNRRLLDTIKSFLGL